MSHTKHFKGQGTRIPEFNSSQEVPEGCEVPEVKDSQEVQESQRNPDTEGQKVQES